MRLLLLGANGQVGWELQRSLAPLGEVIVPAQRADFTQPEALAALVGALKPDVIANAAAYTAVDKAESDAEAARAINATAAAVLAREAATLGAWLLHYSTDYVFDGSGSAARSEDAPTGPVNVYGRTKLEGEQLIRASGCRHLILRTSWVYGTRGGNFAKTMLRLARERERLTVIDDQVGAPTGAELLADLTVHALRTAQQRREVAGTYHAVASGHTSWHGYASHVVAFARQAGQNLKVAPDAIEPVPTSAFPTPARRPTNSRMDTTKLRATFGVTLPDWRAGVDRMLNEVLT